MKKKIAIILTGVLAMSMMFTGCGKKGGNEDGTFVPQDTINWVVTSNPGGGSDIYTRMIQDIMVREDLVNGQTIIVSNKTDGNGEIGRNEVVMTKGKKSDYTLLTFNSGDLMPMVQNTKNRSSNFKIIAIMAVDKQLIFKGKDTSYADFAAAIKAAQDGKKVVIGGSKGDDIATYEALIKEIGISKDHMTYITYDSTGDAITSALGGHVDFVISKPAAATEYVEAGSLIPVLALSTERYTGNLSDAPKLSEIGDYKDVEVPIWRGVAAPTSMSDEAVAYWSEVFGKVSESETWKTDYLEKNKLISNYLDSAAATEFVTEYEKAFMDTNGIK